MVFVAVNTIFLETIIVAVKDPFRETGIFCRVGSLLCCMDLLRIS
jgi:hypothetical protein